MSFIFPNRCYNISTKDLSFISEIGILILNIKLFYLYNFSFFLRLNFKFSV